MSFRLEIDPDIEKRLIAMAHATGADTLLDVIVQAFATYEMLVEEKAKGSKVLMRAENGDEHEVQLKP